jgi:hypothetical protein
MTVSLGKLAALRALVESGETARFETGALVRVERRFVVRTPAGAIVTFLDPELERAYELAMRPLEPLRREMMPDSEADRRWGVDPPW